MERREQDDSYGHVLKYTGIFGGVQGLTILVALLRNKLTVVLLGKAGMGLNKRFANIADVINAWTNFGISFYAVQKISEIYEEGSDDDLRHFVGVIRTWSLWSALLAFSICFFFASWFNDYYFSSDEHHRMEIMLLALFVASLPIEAVECALLKGLRRLRTVALIEVCSAISTLLFTIPLYFLLGLRGIVLSLVLCGWATALIHLFFSVRIYRYSINLFSLRIIRDGWPLIRIGIPYVLAGVAGAMATGEVYKFLGNDSTVGLYSAGYGLMVTYAGMIFKAVDTDFFPRLSSINHDTKRLNHTINQQIDVCVLLVAPVLIVFVLFMPWVIRLLYDDSILPVVPMTVCAVFYMFFRAISIPIAYTSLAKGDSWLFLIMECIYDVAFVVLLCLGYSYYELLGAGTALSLVALFDLVMISTVYGAYYHVHLRMRTLRLILPQALLLAATVAICLCLPVFWKYLSGFVCLMLSVAFSWHSMSAEVPVFQRLERFLKSRNRKHN